MMNLHFARITAQEGTSLLEAADTLAKGKQEKMGYLLRARGKLKESIEHIENLLVEINKQGVG